MKNKFGINSRLFLFGGIVWFFIILYLLTIPGNDLPKISWMDTLHLDKLVHAGLFFILCFLFIHSSAKRENHWGYILMIMLLGCLYGIIMEFVQKYWIPMRSFDVYDMLADGVGSALAVLECYVIKPKSSIN